MPSCKRSRETINPETESKLESCLQCGKCCTTHPCALAPDDLAGIARFLSLSEESVFDRFLVLDYVADSGERHYYLCPARRGDKPGRIVTTDWPFLPSPCIFLSNNRCAIEEVKPRGGREFSCRLMTGSNHDLIRYGKKTAARDWNESSLLIRLLSMTIKNESQARKDQTGFLSYDFPPSANPPHVVVDSVGHSCDSQ